MKTTLISRMAGVGLLAALVANLTACSAKITSEAPPPPPEKILRTSDAPLAGSVEGRNWNSSQAIAFKESNGEYRIKIVGDGLSLDCSLFSDASPFVSIVVPAAPGSHAYSGSLNGNVRMVNMVFYSNSTSYNIFADKSLITIDQVLAEKITGSISAFSDGVDKRYDIAGRFEATICKDNPSILAE